MNQKIFEELKKLSPKIPQRQDDCLSQLEDLRLVANLLGMYDASDFLNRQIELFYRKINRKEHI